MTQPPPFDPPYTTTYRTTDGIRVAETLADGTVRDITSTSHGQALISATQATGSAAQRDGQASESAGPSAPNAKSVPGNRRAMTFLAVPFADKDSAKSFGARWDPAKRKWYVPHGLDINLFERWWPDELKQK
ncbi:DUF5710 domain-containing protein [Noviherbaspirillum sp.]|uniref:DUF5710 domain-containing protein n=1 Tax=Noviherbaspirillum sp. TaxID=1926288 RepID=UPI002FE33162